MSRNTLCRTIAGNKCEYVTITSRDNVDKKAELLAGVRAKKVVLPIDYLPLPMMKLRAQDGYHVKVGDVRYFEVINFTGKPLH